MQRYKVFIYDSPVVFGKITNNVVGDYKQFNWKELDKNNFIDSLKNGDYKDDVIQINSDNIENCFEEFCSHFKKIEAAGGLVIQDQKVLVIKRLGRTDLPKGKLEKSEGIEECAIREVEEECGIDQLKIINPLNNTYHCYYMKGKWMIKTTYWFLMESNTTNTPKPQVEEDIEWVKWIPQKDVFDTMKDTYPSIKPVIEEGLL